MESTTQALCDLALRFGEGEEESMVFYQLLQVVEVIALELKEILAVLL